MDYGSIEPATILHVRAAIEGDDQKLSEVPNILRDTTGLPLTDTGWSIITCPNLVSGIKMTPKTTL